MWSFFRRKHKGWMSVSAYDRFYRRELRRDPLRFQKEHEQAQQWATSVAEKNRLKESSHPQKIKAERTRENASRSLREVVREYFMQHPLATEADFTLCWPSIRQELLKKYTLEELTVYSVEIKETTRRHGEKFAEWRLVRNNEDSRSGNAASGCALVLSRF
jgi:hypothetical protein